MQKHSPGVGIGLSLVERFTQLHHGRVRVEDADPSGARFVVSLPDGRSRWRTNDAAADRPVRLGAPLPA